MRVVERIEQSGMSPEVAEAFRRGLQDVLSVSHWASMEHELLSRAFDRLAPDGAEPAPFEELWPWAELFVTSAIWIAVADGSYGVEEARTIAGLAHRLGFSAAELADLERRIFDTVRARAHAMRKP